jgi:hypothetical protein
MSQYRAYFVPGAVDPIGEYLVARTNDDYPWVSAEPGSKFCCTYKESWGKIWSWTLDGISLGETPMERCKRRMQGVWGGWTTSWRVVSAKKGECPRRLKEPDIFTPGVRKVLRAHASCKFMRLYKWKTECRSPPFGFARPSAGNRNCVRI